MAAEENPPADHLVSDVSAGPDESIAAEAAPNPLLPNLGDGQSTELPPLPTIDKALDDHKFGVWRLFFWNGGLAAATVIYALYSQAAITSVVGIVQGAAAAELPLPLGGVLVVLPLLGLIVFAALDTNTRNALRNTWKLYEHELHNVRDRARQKIPQQFLTKAQADEIYDRLMNCQVTEYRSRWKFGGRCFAIAFASILPWGTALVFLSVLLFASGWKEGWDHITAALTSTSVSTTMEASLIAIAAVFITKAVIWWSSLDLRYVQPRVRL